MKASILKTIAAIVFVCLMLDLAPSLLNNTGATWINMSFFPMRHNFYFAKHQWLADARTIVAAVRYLYPSVSGSPAGEMTIVSNTSLAFSQRGVSANLLESDATESTILFREKLSRAENIIVRTRLLSYEGLPASEWEARNHVAKLRTRLPRTITLPTNGTADVSGILFATPT